MSSPGGSIALSSLAVWFAVTLVYQLLLGRLIPVAAPWDLFRVVPSWHLYTNLPKGRRLRVRDRDVAMRWLASKAVRALLRSDRERAGVMELFRQTRYQWNLSSGWAGKAAVLRPRLMSPTNWQALPLPDRWFGLYYAAGPLLWARRRLGSKLRQP